MGTPFHEVFQLFLSQQAMEDLRALEEDDLEANMKLWLVSAITEFSIVCKQNLDEHDMEMEYFDATLTSNEKNILARWMIYAYLDTHVITEGNIKQALNSKDYRMYSPANQLKALLELKDHLESKANSLMSRYSWSSDSIKERFK